MAGKSNNTACAVALQTAPGMMESMTGADLFPISQLRPNFTPVTVPNDEYTGSVVKNADDVLGSRKSFSYNVKLRPPPALPDANAFHLGRLLQALKFTETRLATSVPASAEAVAGMGQTTTNVRLGATASSTAGMYKGYPLIVSDNGTGYKRQLTQIMSYDATKNAGLPEVLAAAAAANYKIPAFLGYFRGITSDDPPYLSQQFWLDGLRYDLKDVRATSAQLVFPTSSVLGNQAAYPELQITVDGLLDSYTAEATPAIPSLGAIPLFRDGDMWLNRVPVGGSTFTIDLGIQTEAPPNPNQLDGSDAAEITESTARITQTRQRYLPSVIDTLGMSDAQAYHPFWAQYGSGAGAMVQVLAPQVRLAPPSPDMGGGIIMESGDLLIDAIDRALCLCFPYA